MLFLLVPISEAKNMDIGEIAAILILLLFLAYCFNSIRGKV